MLLWRRGKSGGLLLLVKQRFSSVPAVVQMLYYLFDIFVQQ